ncbi:hypothetical protein [Sphingomonas sp.]
MPNDRSGEAIDRFWRNRTITGADGMDRSWSDFDMRCRSASMLEDG